jgi:hypothetical protein
MTTPRTPTSIRKRIIAACSIRVVVHLRSLTLAPLTMTKWLAHRDKALLPTLLFVTIETKYTATLTATIQKLLGQSV